MNNKGQTTILFSLMISFLFLFTVAILEAGRVFLQTVKIKPCVHSMCSSIMADYNEELFERYHLLFMDPTYGTGSEAVAEEKIVDYLETSLNGEEGSSLYQFEVEEVALSKKETIMSNDMQLLKEQIADYQMTAGIAKYASTLAGKLSGTEADVEGAAYETKVNGVELNVSNGETVNGEKNDEDSVSGEKGEDPRETLKNKLKFGILASVMPQATISKDKYKIRNAPSADYEDQKKQERRATFQDIAELNGVLEDAAGEDKIDALLLHASYGDYVITHFGNVAHPKDNTVMTCEVEYILMGRDNDYENVEAVVTDITWIRMVGNYAYLLTDGDKKGQALVLATTICALTGTEPLIEIVKYLLLGCWAYGESLQEMQLLMSGEQIPVIKTSANWYTDLESLTASGMVQGTESGMSYEDYLLLLLTSKTGTSLNNGYARVLDVIQLNLQQAYPNFRIADCVGAMTIQGKVVMNPLFYKGTEDSVYDYYFEESFDYE